MKKRTIICAALGALFLFAGTVAQAQSVMVNSSNYNSSLKITFSGYNQAGAVTNFPVLVRLSTNIAGFSYAQFASPIGADLQFTAASNTQALPYEIEQWNPAGESIVWVQVPLISVTNDYIMAYWGNPAQTNAAASNTNGAVWIGPFSATSNYELMERLVTVNGTKLYIDGNQLTMIATIRNDFTTDNDKELARDTLQSVNQVTGPYTEVLGAVAPHTVLFRNVQSSTG